MLLDGDGIIRASLYGSIVGHNHTFNSKSCEQLSGEYNPEYVMKSDRRGREIDLLYNIPLDTTNTGDDTASRNVLFVQIVTGKSGELKKRRVWVQESGDSVTDQHLASLNMLVAGHF